MTRTFTQDAPIKRSAVISEDNKYRYRLDRDLGRDGNTAAFIMVNPSTADAEADDATIRKLIGFSRRFGFGRFIVGNKFAYRATEVAELKTASDPVGPANDVYLDQIIRAADIVIAAWGPLAKLPRNRRSRWSFVDFLAASHGKPLPAGWTPSDLIAAGWTPSDLIAAGWTPSDLIAVGWTPSDLIAAGWTPSDLRAAGWTPSDLRAAGWTPSDLRAAGWTPSDLRAAGWTPSDLRAAGWTPSDLRAAGEEVPLLEKPYSRLLEEIKEEKRRFDQSTFGPGTYVAQPNICNTAMCTAGHLVSMAGEAGWELHKKYGFSGAARLIHYKAHPDWPCQNFGSIPDSWALAYIESMADRETEEDAKSAGAGGLNRYRAALALARGEKP